MSRGYRARNLKRILWRNDSPEDGERPSNCHYNLNSTRNLMRSDDFATRNSSQKSGGAAVVPH